MRALEIEGPTRELDEERFVPKQVTWFIAGSKDGGLRPQDVEQRDENTRVMVQVYQAYEEQCQRCLLYTSPPTRPY